MRIPLAACLVALVFLAPVDFSVQAQSRIIGGGVAPVGAYPWMAALVEKGKTPARGQICGGMLVAPQWVLTAAHCVEGENRNTLDIWVNLHDLRATGGASKRKIKTIFRHPNYRADRFDNLFYDAALILLESPVAGVSPVSLASTASHNDVGALVRVIGWGATDPVFDIYPNRLHEADLQIYDVADAQDDYQNSLGPAHLAAGVPDGSRDTCSGDSGGPIFRIISGNHILIGITSFGEGCATPGIQGVYTNILHIRAWIDGRLQLTANPPDMSLRYRSRSIASGDQSPSFSDGTNFGGTRVRGRGKNRTFKLRNDGAGLLIVGNLRVPNSNFYVINQVPELVNPGGNPSVRVNFAPRRRGRIDTAVRVNSNDPDNPFFWFRIRGKGR